MWELHHRGRRVSPGDSRGTMSSTACAEMSPWATGHRGMPELSAWRHSHLGWDRQRLAPGRGWEMWCQIRAGMLRSGQGCYNQGRDAEPRQQPPPVGTPWAGLTSSFRKKITYGTPPRKSCQAAATTGADKEPGWMKPLFFTKKTCSVLNKASLFPRKRPIRNFSAIICWGRKYILLLQ